MGRLFFEKLKLEFAGLVLGCANYLQHCPEALRRRKNGGMDAEVLSTVGRRGALLRGFQPLIGPNDQNLSDR